MHTFTILHHYMSYISFWETVSGPQPQPRFCFVHKKSPKVSSLIQLHPLPPQRLTARICFLSRMAGGLKRKVGNNWDNNDAKFGSTHMSYYLWA